MGIQQTLAAAADRQGSREFIAISRLQGPIEQLSQMQRSLLFAELSKIAYMEFERAERFAGEIGLPVISFLDREGAQAYLFTNDVDCVVACRGTEPHEWNDIRADANAWWALAETVGHVHKGFKQEVDELWPILETVLKTNTKVAWFTGHSLGGAMATICAGRCLLSHIATQPKQMYTYGSPRVGNKRYINYCEIDYIRWVNNNDIVTRVPPPWLGYRHTGKERYLNSRGLLRNLTGWQRTKDRWRGLWRTLQHRKIDHFYDHSIDLYIEYVLQNLIAMGEQPAGTETEERPAGKERPAED